MAAALAPAGRRRARGPRQARPAGHPPPPANRLAAPGGGAGADGRATKVKVSLGTGGLRLHANLPAAIGELLQISIPVRDFDRAVQAQARVAWRREDSLGVELLDLTEADRELLEAAVVEAMLRPR